MKQIIKLVFFLAATSIFIHCGDDDKQEGNLSLEDFEVSSTVSTDGSGVVNFIATAANADSYYFYFGDSNTNAFISDDGLASHTYTSSGVYTVNVVAFTAANDSESVMLTVEVIVDGSDTGTDVPSSGYTTPESYDGLTLVWRDEFDGTQLNTQDWSYEIGTGSNGWGNNELQYYRQENTTVKDGFLFIEARQESFNSSGYTSSRLITSGKQSFQYGRVDIRAALPKGQGIWPALWMLGDSFESVGWPACGEIDIMELIGGGEGKDDTVHGTIHWDNAGSYANYGQDYQLSSGIFNEEFHVFSIIWDESSITWYVDDVQYNVVDITPSGLSEFQQKFFFIFNVAVGGNWPGSPDSSTVFPQTMIVDYIRVFQ